MFKENSADVEVISRFFTLHLLTGILHLITISEPEQLMFIRNGKQSSFVLDSFALQNANIRFYLILFLFNSQILNGSQETWMKRRHLRVTLTSQLLYVEILDSQI